MKFQRLPGLLVLLAAVLTSTALVACGGAVSGAASANNGQRTEGAGGPKAVFYFSGIPDQDVSRWAQRYEAMASYLSSQLGVEVRGASSVDYAAVVTGFERGDIHLAWFGGLTGVQARLAVPDSEAIAQRPLDEQFHSVFIAGKELLVGELKDLKGLTFTFGSESSTSGSLMPRYFLMKAGVGPEKDFRGKPNYSGSHDTTWKLVESGAFQSGVLSEEVWDRAIKEGKVDLTKVKEFYRTPAYYDYHWGIRGDVDKTFGPGFKDRVKQSLLSLNDPRVLGLFATDKFIPTKNENYQVILDVAKETGLVR